MVLDSLGIEALMKAGDRAFDAGRPRPRYTVDRIVLFRIRLIGPLKQYWIFLTGQLDDRF